MVDTEDTELSVDSLKTAIEDILKSCELASLTSRMVRSKLEERFNVCLKHRKKEIDELLMTMIEESQEQKNEDSDEPTNGAVDDEKQSESEEEEYEPVAKKTKKEKQFKESKSSATAKQKEDLTDSEPEEEEKDDHDDAEIARKLHESERGLRKRKSAKRASKSSTKKEPKPKGEKGRTGFGKPMVLSPELADILGTDQLSRSEVVKKMWAIIKERNLADPKDKRYHICDDQLLKVFGTKRVKTFCMMKYLNPHVKDPTHIT